MMMNFSSFTVLFLLLVTLFVTTTSVNAAESPSPKLTPEKQAILNKACESDPANKDLCISTFGELPEYVKDMAGVARDAVFVVMRKAEKTQLEIEEMVAKTKDRATKTKLQHCNEMYIEIAAILQESLQTIEQTNSFDPTIEELTVAAKDVKSCDDELKKPPVVPSPLTETNNMFSKLCSICLAMTKSAAK